MEADLPHKERTPSPISDDEKQAHLVEHLDYKARFPDLDERKLIRKIDLHVVPMICILYFLAFLDRANISNAALFNLKTDLKLTGNEYNTALVILRIPSNALMKRFKPHIWLSGCMFFFGLTACLQGLAQNYGGILAARFFLGLFECNMFPGCFYLLAMWYKRSEAQKRYSFFFCSTTLAGAFGGLLAAAIGNMDGILGHSGWRWIFILEGLLTSIVGILSFFLISDFPEEAKWLSAEEKDFVKTRLQEDVGKIIFGGFMYFGLIVPAYGYTYFAPAIIQSLGHSNIRTQLLSVPPWACAFVVSMIVATLSDYVGHRYLFMMVTAAVSMAGFAILFRVHDDQNLQYGALFLAATGAFSSMPVIVCWFSTNLAGHRRRAIGTAWQIGFDNTGGIIATYSFLAQDAPKYIKGYSICISFICLSMVSCFAYLLHVEWLNRKRDREGDNGTNLPWEEKQELGDLNPDYRYLL
ncbi:uncharacterized protein PHACADRAFT_205855 [Phanerochaete carnosa HHB-10118-sp]|uniref:Major facilitator superfamily (MFS) profile domain-containing protein n=1 Tax=Phanerochaete carnosa (strain HHB-10118-sp) TaxID=650164 RepID=K5WJN9_PHACS|nr:uncharacterized protein PHACADRAFT_205855 [Phanerochaete carnosa HHB-10118-sp]EKM59630.1 hypothetical protein PHACADRAFT_205855 [Phanerochaete carnosa HHB-10118-sp]